jgi:hypothetical protein
MEGESKAPGRAEHPRVEQEGAEEFGADINDTLDDSALRSLVKLFRLLDIWDRMSTGIAPLNEVGAEATR